MTDLIEKIAEERKERVKKYYQDIYSAADFQNSLRYSLSVRDDFLKTIKYISIMGWRFSARENLLLLRYHEAISL